MEAEKPSCLCDICGKQYTNEKSLARHKKTHDADLRVSCEFCDQTFSRNDVRKQHLEKVHGIVPAAADADMEKNHQCTFCTKSFSMRKNLLRHVRTDHGGDEVPPDNPPFEDSVDDPVLQENEAKRPRLLCSYCPATYTTVGKLNQHLRDKHGEEKSSGGMLCPRPSCDWRLASLQGLSHHLVSEHDFVDEEELIYFPSMTAFSEWKESMERERVCRYVKYTGAKEVASGLRSYYVCHRSGVFNNERRLSEAEQVRLRKCPSIKMDAACPARLIATEGEDGSVEVKWHMNHAGHSFSLSYLRLTQMERELLRSKLKQGVSFERILDDIRDSVLDQGDEMSFDKFTRFHLTTRRDLWNIMQKLDLKLDQAHPCDALSVEMIVEEFKNMKQGDPVLFYKPQDRPCCPCENPLADEDFMLVLCTRYQSEVLSRFLSDKVLMDSTHGTNPYKFDLTAVVSIDESSKGVPVAFCVSNRTNTQHMEKFLFSLKVKLGGPVKAKVFMSDMAEALYNAWSSVMGHVDVRLFCSWHVDKAWWENLSKIKDLEKRGEVYRDIKVLTGILVAETFEEGFQVYVNRLLEDEDTYDFGVYFRDYFGKCRRQWASCYRVGIGLNVNMFVEALWKKIKYMYLKGKLARRLDKVLRALMRLARDVAFERIIRLCKGNDSLKQAKVHQRHVSGASIPADYVTCVEPGSKWYVLSSQPSLRENGIQYLVQMNASHECVGDCGLVCAKCKVCALQYTCQCEDYISAFNMCKHIHACVLTSLVRPNCGGDEARLAVRIEEEVECLIRTVSRAGPSRAPVGIGSMWRSVSNQISCLLSQGIDCSQALLDGGLRFLELLREKALPEASAQAGAGNDLTDELRDELPLSNLGLNTPPRRERCPAVASVASPRFTADSTPPKTPTRCNITPQRGLKFRSTRAPRRENENARHLKKPTLAETAEVFQKLFGESQAAGIPDSLKDL